MQNDDTTIFSLGEQAAELAALLSDVGISGMSKKQAVTMIKSMNLLDRIAKTLGKFESTQTGELVAKAGNHALAMRIHSATIRGVAGAEMIENLCDAVIARHLNGNQPAVLVVAEDMTVGEGMIMLGCNSLAEFSRQLGCSLTSIQSWKAAGYMTKPWADKVRKLYRGQQVRAA